ncbi:MAG: TIGR03013 family PEP-CTERM/XrtA system glycosyltransferase [Burkholderiales bacterium]|nr:TIGR03013 family PEP-CTERM/XrtA system glycosyltransferase [Burkholderiales bacterium]
MAVLRQYLSVAAVIQLLVEAAWFAGAVVVAVALQRHGRGLSDGVFAPALVFAALLVAANGVAGLYRSDRDTPTDHFVWRAVGALLAAGGVTYLVLRITPLGRPYADVMLEAAVLAFLGFLVLRKVVFARANALANRVLVIGAGEDARGVERALDGFRHGKPEIVGFYPIAGREVAVPEERLLRADERLPAVARRLHATEIIVAVRDQRGGVVPMDELLECRLAGIPVQTMESFYEKLRGRVPVDSLKSSWLVYGDGFRQSWLRNLEKRAVDLGASLVLIVAGLPVMLLAAIAIVLDSGFPILYRQERVGRAGRTFTVWKFRTMQQDAEADGRPRWAQAGDPRVTRVGRFLRRTRIDEMPQLFNVLKGDMSLVGPRPERPGFVAELAKDIPFYNARHSVKPGITGWAQVRYTYGASVEDAKKKLEYDLYYVKNHSLVLDLLILVETVRVVVFQEGAH